MPLASDVDQTLRYLIPGFVALKVFYQFGLQGRRTDLELTLWSLLAAAVVNTVLDRLAAFPDPDARLLVALTVAVVGGWVGARAWNALADRNLRLRTGSSRRAWDVVLYRKDTPWIQVWTSDGRVIHGWPEIVALSAEADVLDLYLRQPSWVEPQTQERTEMTGVSGVIVPETSIVQIQILKDDPD